MNTRNVVVLVALAGAMVAGAVDFTVDFAKETGTIRRINGISNLTPLSGSKGGKMKGLLKPLEASRTHLHDDALLNPGYALVDVSRIFPLFHVDADDPRNYNFKPTDDYLRTAIEEGIEIDFRLGEAIEHSMNRYCVKPPADYAKWADICSHIIRHYNEGWADGFKWNIRYWSIWEEPDTNPELLDAPNAFFGAYFDMYRTVAPILKKRFPNIRISGPQCGSWNVRGREAFVKMCVQEKIPLDVLSWTSYVLRPEDYYDQVAVARKLLDANGLRDTEIAIVEWHYGPVSWNGHGQRNSKAKSEEWRRHLNSVDSMAFTAATLSLMQDSAVDMMNFYSMKSPNWGIFDTAMQPNPPYWALVAFAQLAHGRTRVAAPTKPADGWYALASKEENGRGHLLVTAFKAYGDLHVAVKGGLKPVRVRLIDAASELEEISGWSWKDGKLWIPRFMCDSACWLVDFEKES